MAFLTKTEFARKFGRDSRWLHRYTKKGEVILNGDYIDDQHHLNKSFIAKWQSRPPKRKPDLNKSINEELPLLPSPNIPSSPTNQSDSVYGIDAEIKDVELKKKKVDLELSEEKLRKVRGETVPVDLIKTIFQQYGKANTTAFYSAADNLIQEFQKKFNISRKDMAMLRARLIDITNESSEDAAQEAKNSLKVIVEEYSQKRGIGERV